MNTSPDRPFYRLPITFPLFAVAGSLVLAVILFAVAAFVIQMPVLEAVIGAVLGVALHWVLVICHHLGHAYAAMRAGYPMNGIRCGNFGILAVSLYPTDEPTLPGRVHIQRALGGPILSGVIAVVFFVLVLLTRDQNTLLAWLLRYGLVDSLMLSLGAFTPVSFLDGGSILYWLRHS